MQAIGFLCHTVTFLRLYRIISIISWKYSAFTYISVLYFQPWLIGNCRSNTRQRILRESVLKRRVLLMRMDFEIPVKSCISTDFSNVLINIIYFEIMFMYSKFKVVKVLWYLEKIQSFKTLIKFWFMKLLASLRMYAWKQFSYLVSEFFFQNAVSISLRCTYSVLPKVWRFWRWTGRWWCW
jgi:hypothetical protein